MRRRPSNSLKVIGLRRSADVNRSTDSSRPPSIHTSSPHAWSLASVPAMIADGAGSTRMGVQFAVSRALRIQTRSRQNPAQTRTCRHSPISDLTDPRIQSTSSPPSCRTMACMKVRPPGSTSAAKTSWPTNEASSLGPHSVGLHPTAGRSCNHLSSKASVRRWRDAVRPMH
eukprot:6117109-Prymnesium_polylepis.1